MSITVRNETAMKYGMRKPSWKKSLSARTKGRATRAVKRALIPGYGKKGMGWLHPKRKLYNTIYKEDHVQPVRPVQVVGNRVIARTDHHVTRSV